MTGTTVVGIMSQGNSSSWSKWCCFSHAELLF